MRKCLKEDILELFKTIYEAHKTIESFINEGKSDAAKSVLADCQESVLQIGEIIENSENNIDEIIGQINDYCKYVFELYNDIPHESAANEIADNLDNKLYLIEKRIKEDIKIRFEILFLPYKASMFDSFESIWKAANEDPECDVYVVPIPYYDRNPDRSYGELHYEGNLYPEYVPITHFESYDIAARKPDVIYICNPYDECNYVTTIHPKYYSSELKKYTEKLVYVPYFVVDERRSLDKINHYAVTPGVINSDYVIVQSEKIRQKYIDVLLPYYGNTLDAKKLLENKICGWGSPKFDAVKSSKNMMESLPEEWKETIGNENKKIIFFNTHLSLLMAVNYKQFLIKLNMVFEFFKSRDDVILLWRPHPLALSTAKSMNPVAVGPYLEMVEKYRNEKWGIYDDTSDMDRAIALSDIYYGSESSVVPVFNETGKPIMIMNINCDNNKMTEIFRISPSAFCIVGDEIYMFHSMMNLLVKYNVVSQKTEAIGKLEGEENFQGTLISDMFYKNGKIVLIPCWAKNIYTYDVASSSFSKIKYDTAEKVDGLFIKSYMIENYIYCIPFWGKEIIVIDTDKFDIVKKIDIKSSINREYEFINSVCLASNEKIAFVSCDSYINIFNIKDCSIESYFTGNEDSVLVGITFSKDVFYLIDKNKYTFIKWDTKKNELQTLYSVGIPFIIFSRDCDVVLDIGNKYVVYDIENSSFSDIISREFSTYNNSLSYSYNFSLFAKENETDYEFDRTAEQLYITKDNNRISHTVELKRDDLMPFLDSESLYESELYGIKELVNNNKNKSETLLNTHALCGDKIHSFIRSK